MYFEKTLVLNDIGMSDGQTITFTSEDTPLIHLEISQRLLGNEQKLLSRECVCVVRTEEEVSRRIAEQVVAATEAEKEYSRTYKTAVVMRQPPTSPPAVTELTKRVLTRMSDFASKVAKLIRWRVSKSGDHRAIQGSRGTKWSADGQTWEAVPGQFHMTLLASASHVKPDDKTLASVQALLKENEDEPLAHEILREAVQNQHSSRRSSLLIGIAAAEVGVKSLIARLIPDAAWLALNAPTPPLVLMLQDYLPLLPVKKTFANGDIAPFVPKTMLDVLNKGVKLRNEATHAGGTIAQDTLTDVLNTVRDLLYLLDFYSGQDWSLEHLSYKNHEELRKEISKKKTPKA